MRSRLYQGWLYLGIAYLALGLSLASIPRCDLLLKTWQLALQEEDAQDESHCHPRPSSEQASSGKLIKRMCPCLLLVFPLVALAEPSFVPKVLRAESFFSILQSPYLFSLQTSDLSLATPPPRMSVISLSASV